MDIFLDLRFIQIKWYSILILTAFMVGYFLASHQAKKNNISQTIILDLLFYLIPVCIIGARIYYVIFEWEYYSNNLIEIVKIWEGGLAIHGGLIAGLIFLFYFCKKRNLKLIDLTDILTPSLILGQAIGRWGNFFNQEAFGPITTYSNLAHKHIPEFIINGMYINGKYHIPTFLYESLWCLIGFILIIIVRKIFKNKKGLSTSLYFIVYGIGRFYIELLRQDSLMFINLKVAQLVSVIMILIGLILLIYYIIKSRKI